MQSSSMSRRDEPLLPARLIAEVAPALGRPAQAVHIATLVRAHNSAQALFDPAVVKVVRDGDGLALYFSRAPIPWHRDAFAGRAVPACRHRLSATHRHLRLSRILSIGVPFAATV